LKVFIDYLKCEKKYCQKREWGITFSWQKLF